MQNHNRNSNIELGFHSSNSQLNRISSGPQHSGYLPQRDEDSPTQPQLSQGSTQNLSTEAQPRLWLRFRSNQMTNIAIILILCFCIVESVLLCCGLYYFVKQYDFQKMTNKSLSKPLQFMKADLNADPIMDIQIMEKGSTCPAGFQILKLGTWLGTKAGCLCENGDLHGTSCENLDAERCEKDIPSTLPIDMFEWNNSIWCVKRAVLGIDYLRKAKCPTTFKECYPGGCFVGDCPITKIEIGSNVPLALAKTQGELPIINAQITFGDIPCFIQDLFDQSIKNFTYELSVVKENSCDKYGLDIQSSTRLASQTAYDLFIENYLPYYTMNLPYFKENATVTPSILSSKVRMKTAKHDDCLNIDENPIDQFIEVSKRTVWVLMGMSYILGFRIGCFIAICLRMKPRSAAELFRDSSRSISNFRLCNIICFVGVILMLIPFNGLYQGFQVMKANFQKYNELRCFAGGQGGMVISDFLEMLKDIEIGFWIYWVLLATNVSYVFIHILSYVVKKMSSI